MKHSARTNVPWNRRELAVALALAAGTLAIFAPACAGEFVNYDDLAYVSQNANVQAGLTLKSAWWALTSTELANWHPLTWLSLQLDCRLCGRQAWGFHLTNVLLHAANTVVLFALLRRMTGALWPSALTAALFAAHPLHVESVAWVAERKDVLSALFWLLTMTAYVRYAERPSVARYLTVLVLYALGLMAKPMLVTLPLVLLLLDYWPLWRWRVERGGWREAHLSDPPPSTLHLPPPGGRNSPAPWTRLLVEKLPLLVLALATCVMAFLAHRAGGAVRTMAELSLPLRAANAAIAYVAYLGNMFWPVDLVPLYLHLGSALPAGRALGAGMILAAITVWVFAAAVRRPYLLVGWLWYLGTLVPVIGFVQVGVQSMADRYTYIPLIGIFMALSWGMADLVRAFHIPRAVTALIAAAVLTVCAVLTWSQVGHWRDSIALWSHTVKVSPANDVAHNNLGAALGQKGAADAASEHYEQALALEPTNVDAHINLGVLLGNQHQQAAALQHLESALKLDPENAAAHYHLGLLFAQLGDFDRAIEEFHGAIRSPGGFPGAHHRLGLVLLSKGLPQEAMGHLFEEIRLRPDDVDARNNLGLALLQQGRTAEARDQFEEGVRLQPNLASTQANLGIALSLEHKTESAESCFREAARLEPQSPRYHFDLAHALMEGGAAADARAEYSAGLRLDPNWPEAADRAARLLATNAEPAGRQGPLAARLAEQACEATDHERAEYVDTLAAAYAEAGRFEDAVVAARKTLTLTAPSSPERSPREARLRLYERRQPYHQSALGAQTTSSP